MSKTQPKIRDLANQLASLAEPFVKLEYLDAIDGTPAAGQFRSSVQNRAQCVDFSKDLRPRMGVERIMTQEIMLVDGESGPAGQPVYKSVNDQFEQMRMVGGFQSYNNTTGTYISVVGSGFVEITFYGTGLNLLAVDFDGSRDARVTIDGDAEAGSSFMPTSASNILAGRNYSANSVIPVASGLLLDLHTIKIRAGSPAWLRFTGFEILNEAADITVPQGTAWVNGEQQALTTNTTTPYGSGFEGSPALNGRGGHVSIVLEDNEVKKYLTQTGTAAYLGSSNHSNEEVLNTYFWREFGAGRSDDFSTVPPSTVTTRGSTLSDNTTNLVIKDGISTEPDGLEVIALDGFTDYCIFNFIGTGLDLFMNSSGTLGMDVKIDGVSQGSVTDSITSNAILPVASGLKYGSHTATFTRTSGDAPKFIKFLVYGPKKPTLPDNAIELGSYFLMSTFSANSTSSHEAISSGIHRHGVSREFVAVEGTGSGSNLALSTASLTATVMANTLYGSKLNASISYSFFGAGFDMRFIGHSNRSSNISVYVDDVLFNSSHPLQAGATISTYGDGGEGFTAGTGILDQITTGDTIACGFVVADLPLGFHTVKFVNGTDTDYLEVESMDIITPIHSHKLNGPHVKQNALRVGNESIGDSRNFGLGLPKNTEVVTADAIFNSPNTTSSSDSPLDDMLITIDVKQDGLYKVNIDSAFYHNTIAGQKFLNIAVDGATIATTTSQQAVAGHGVISDFGAIVPLSAGQHTIYITWSTNTGTFTSWNYRRWLSVIRVS